MALIIVDWIRLKNWLTPTYCSRRKNLTMTGLVALTCTAILPSLSAPWRIHYFLPVLVSSVYQRSIPFCFWLAIITGLAMSLLAGSSYRLGVYPLAHLCAVSVLIRLKSYFFTDHLSTVPTLTFLSSLVVTGTLAAILILTKKTLHFSLFFICLDGILMGFLDALYAAVFFVLPGLLIRPRQRSAKDFFQS